MYTLALHGYSLARGVALAVQPHLSLLNPTRSTDACYGYDRDTYLLALSIVPRAR